MKSKRFKSVMFLALIIGLSAVSMAAGAGDRIAESQECPTVLQSGEVDITIPAGETVGRADLQFIRCAGMNVQVTGGSMLETPVIINAIAHHDYLILRAYMQEPQPGPFDVTIWWRVE